MQPKLKTRVVLSYSDDGLTSIKFSMERTLKRMVVIFAATSQMFGKSVMARTQGLIEQPFIHSQFK